MGTRTTHPLQKPRLFWEGLEVEGLLKGEAGILGQVSSQSSQHTHFPSHPASHRALYLPGEEEGEERGRGGGGQGAESSPTYSE